MAAAALVAGGFLLGALPWALWVGRLVRGVDVRQHGSGNLGATNALRILGPGWGLLILGLDIGKGVLATAVLPGALGLGSVGTGSPWPLAGAVAAVLGHNFTPLAGFRGGKGVATSLGAFLALAPWAALVGGAGFVLTVWRSGYVSLGSLVMAVLFPVVACFRGPEAPLGTLVIGLGVLLAVLVALRHRANWARIRAGVEARFRWRSN